MTPREASFLGYLWALPVTFIGLSLALFVRLSGGKIGRRGYVLEVHGGVLKWFLRAGRLWKGGAAMTVGEVILARDASCLARSRAHEMKHVRQFERWGVFLLPVYFLIGAWLWVRGFDPYLDHPMEPPPE